MQENKRNVDNSLQSSKLIDPDPAVIAGLIFSGLAAITPLYSIISDIRLNEERKQKFQSEFIGFRNTVDQISFSLYLFRMSIHEIDRIIIKASKRQDKEMNLLDQTMQYGKISLYLYEVEFNNYSIAYQKIMDSIYLYNTGLLQLERFICEFSPEMTDQSRVGIVSELSILVAKFNEIDSRKMTYSEFIKILRTLLKKIEDIILKIRRIYIQKF